jgi:hypothetical protein
MAALHASGKRSQGFEKLRLKPWFVLAWRWRRPVVIKRLGVPSFARSGWRPDACVSIANYLTMADRPRSWAVCHFRHLPGFGNREYNWLSLIPVQAVRNFSTKRGFHGQTDAE